MDDLIINDFPIKIFNTMEDRDWENERMFMVNCWDFSDFLKALDYENITVIFCLGVEAYDKVHEVMAQERKMFKCYIIRL
jgi:hypothetical protein